MAHVAKAAPAPAGAATDGHFVRITGRLRCTSGQFSVQELAAPNGFTAKVHGMDARWGNVQDVLHERKEP